MNPGVAIKGWCIGLVAASAFLALSTIGLERQGLYYDEVHQAPAAFYYVGEHPSLFVYPVFGVPVLNMTYSGAIKSAAYGVYLRLSGARFTGSAGGSRAFCLPLPAYSSSIDLRAQVYLSQALFCFSDFS